MPTRKSSHLSKEPQEQQQDLIHSRPVHLALQQTSFENARLLDYRGFQNLILLLLIASSLRLVIENYQKYGILVTLGNTVTSQQKNDIYVALCLIVACAASSLVTFVLELARTPTNSIKASNLVNAIVTVLQIVNIAAMMCATIVYTYYHIDSPFYAGMPCMVSTVAALKQVSYILVNQELRQLYIDGMRKVYPYNLTVGNIVYFTCVPTLCYQLEYPTTDRIRPFYVAKRLLECITFTGLIIVLNEQYSKPILENSIKMTQLDVDGKDVVVSSLKYFERILKLSIPVVLAWILSFYTAFYSYFNLWAELTRFGDRQFFQDWWNSQSYGEYWRKWNLPVRNFILRHIYMPIRKRGAPKWVAYVMVFLVSAVLHEVLIGIPLKVGVDFFFHKQSSIDQMSAMYAFWCMVAQVPMIMLSEGIIWLERRITGNQKSHVGNYFFWISFCILGQPLVCLLYYRAWYVRTQAEMMNK